MLLSLSARKYLVYTCINGVTEQSTESLTEIEQTIALDSCPEMYYAFAEVIDVVLSLKIKESVYFQPIRDDKASKGIICRLS